jgi:polyisoprenoid-binding protein YceI
VALLACSCVGRLARIAVAVLIVGALAAVAGPWVYINLIREDAPDRLTLSTVTTSSAVTTEGADNGVEGLWLVGPGSVAGYRVKEILFGQDTEGVGRTEGVSGEVTIEGSQVTSATFVVDMTGLRSDSSRRDGQVAGRILDVATYPEATFVLTSPIDIPADAGQGTAVTVLATGDLTLRGSTRPVEITIEAVYGSGEIRIVASMTIVFTEWGIPDPSLPGIEVESDGLLELSLALRR